jgi:hypothetical protein
MVLLSQEHLGCMAKPTHHHRHKVPKNLGQQPPGVIIRGVSILQKGTGKNFYVQQFTHTRVPPHHPLGQLDTELGPLITVGVVRA